MPLLTEAIGRWRRRTLILDAIVASLLAVFFIFLYLQFGTWEGVLPDLPWFLDFSANPNTALGSLALILGGLGYLHFQVRRLAARSVGRWLEKQSELQMEKQSLLSAFRANTRFYRSLFASKPKGWGRGSRKRLHKVIAETDRLVQQLNDSFASPSGAPVALAADSTKPEPSQKTREFAKNV